MPRKRAPQVDFIILGSGIAGMRAAIELAAHGQVLVLTKDEPLESSTEHAQGGIAAALSEDDEVSLHLHDTLRAGDGLCRESAVHVLVEEGPKLIHELMEWGTRFDRNGTKLAFTREGAHSRSRVLHAHGDSTGHEILRALMAKARTLPSVRVQPFAFAIDLLIEGDRVVGVLCLDEKAATVREVRARSVLLATGGLGQAYRETTNPAVACGDGVAIAYRAGAVVSDMEFVQFHPTALYVASAPRFLLSEALRGEGAQLRNLDLERFMPRYHEAAELAPRDIVSRAIVKEIQNCHAEFVYLDLTALDPEHVKSRFPKIYSTCLKYNIDITTDLVPVRPAAHYAMGGVATDLDGATNLRGLFAAGEVAATGVHGANRLASNSLLEGLVFGTRAARAMAADHPSFLPPPPPPPFPPSPHSRPEKFILLPPEEIIVRVRSLLWDKVGIIRNGKDLCAAAKELGSLGLVPGVPSRRYYEAQNILEVARLITHAALARQESRGAHYRSDHPLKNDGAPPAHSYLSKNHPVYFASSG